jgi:hypothetical protein
MDFKKYMHLERYGNDAVDGIEAGINYIFPKLDGTNAQVWVDAAGNLKAGSRNRTLTLDNDNAGFYNWATQQANLLEFFAGFPEYRLYGEWLVPHSLKTYRDDSWRRFYIFDVEGPYGHKQYDEYQPILEEYGLDYLAPLAIIKNGSYEQYQQCLQKNVFLIQDGQGIGEGIVIKNYGFVNKFGDQIWAKMISNAFKEVHHKEMGAPIVGHDLIEEKIIRDFVTGDLVKKVYAKIVVDQGGWESKYIPRLLETVFYDLITEEMWDILKKYNNPKIDFRLLKTLTIAEVKRTMSTLF